MPDNFIVMKIYAKSCSWTVAFARKKIQQFDTITFKPYLRNLQDGRKSCV